MRFKKGCRIEVLSKKEVPSGSWRCAEIICGNGHKYTVKYDGHVEAADGSVVERVSRKAIRPCPPPVEDLEDWVSGDIVEVLDNFSWKMASVLKAWGRKYYLVRLLGSSREFIVSKFDVRVRQSWQDDGWVVIGKGSRNCEEEKCNEKSALKYNHDISSRLQQNNARINLCLKDVCSASNNNINFEKRSSISLKRQSPYCYSQVEAYAGKAQKFIVVEKEGRHQRDIAASPSLLPENVDIAACPQEMLGDKFIHSSFNNRTTGFSVMDVKRRKTNGAVSHSLAVSLEHNDADTVTCSVGSCSITSNNHYELPHYFSTGPVEDIEGHSSDAESFCQLGYEEGDFFLPTKDELAAEIHSLELHAYRCTMEALHASGPLSWEQETLVTNLRLSLHISNDEHLMEIRNLVSANTSIPIR